MKVTTFAALCSASAMLWVATPACDGAAVPTPSSAQSSSAGAGAGPAPSPCETCVATECGGQRSACEAEPGCLDIEACVVACPASDAASDAACGDACRGAHHDVQNWWPLRACEEHHCGAPCAGALPAQPECGLLSIVYCESHGSCCGCARAQCCMESWICSESFACYQAIQCALACLAMNQDCPPGGGQACRDANPDGFALLDTALACFGTCGPGC